MAQVDTIPAAEVAPRRFKFRQSIRSDVGLRRDDNQDSYGYAHSHRVSFFIVADGMGGARGGATASALAVDVILHSFLDSSENVTEDSLREAIEKANSIVFETSREDELLTGMGTTVVALAFVGDRALLAHVGDSRGYYFSGGQLRQLTRDHTLVQELVESGAIAAKDAAHHPIAHMLTRSLGPTSAVQVEPQTLPEPIKAGDKFFLCCDGLYNLVADEEIQKLVGDLSPDDATKALVNLALERGGTDNITVEVFEVCELEDDSFAFDQPPPGKIRIVVSKHDSSGADITEPERPENTELPSVEETPASESVEGHSESKMNGALAVPIVDGEIQNVEIAGGEVTRDTVAETAPKVETEPEPEVEANPIDSIIFGANPTASDIEARLKKSQKKKPSEAMPSIGSLDKAAGDDDEADAVSPGEIAEIRRLQIAAGGFFLLALAAVAFVFIQRHHSPKSPIAPGREPAITVAIDPVKTAGTAIAPTVVPTAAPIAQASVIPAATNAPTTSETAAPSQGPVGNAEVSPKQSEVSWPIADVVPNVPAGTVTTPVAGRPPSVATGTDSGSIEQAIAKASQLEVGPAPQLSTSDRADQPIDWKSEKDLVGNVLEGDVKVHYTNPLLTEDEKRSISESKVEVRDKISDIDSKLAMFDLQTPEALKAREAETQQAIAATDAAISQINSRLENAIRRQRLWLERKAASAEKDPIKLADEVGTSDPEVKKNKSAYEIAYLHYQDAIDVWHNKPNDPEAVANMSAFGRELKAERSHLEEAVINAIDGEADQAGAEIGNLSLTITDLQRQLEHLNRSLGYLKAYRPSSSHRTLDRAKDLISERNKLAEKLEDLRAKISDADEVAIRRTVASKAYGVAAAKNQQAAK